MIIALAVPLWLAVGSAGLADRTAPASPPALDLAYYLPDALDHDPDVPTPREVLGYEVGEWHVRHDQLVRYFEVLAEHSDRFQLTDYGRTHEGRRLLLAVVTAHATAERIRRASGREALAPAPAWTTPPASIA